MFIYLDLYPGTFHDRKYLEDLVNYLENLCNIVCIYFILKNNYLINYNLLILLMIFFSLVIL